jgi:hypothetical protein
VVRVPGYRSRGPVRFPALPDFLRSSGSGTGPTQPREYNCLALKSFVRTYGRDSVNIMAVTNYFYIIFYIIYIIFIFLRPTSEKRIIDPFVSKLRKYSTDINEIWHYVQSSRLSLCWSNICSFEWKKSLTSWFYSRTVPPQETWLFITQFTGISQLNNCYLKNVLQYNKLGMFVGKMCLPSATCHM